MWNFLKNQNSKPLRRPKRQFLSMFLKLPNLISRKIWAVGKIQNVERLILSKMAFSEIPNLLKLISRKIFSFFLADLHLTMASREQQRLLPATHPISDQPPRPWRPILLGLTRPPMPLRKTWWIGTAIASLLIRAYNVRASLMVGQKTSSLPYVISKRVKTHQVWPLFHYLIQCLKSKHALQNWWKQLKTQNFNFKKYGPPKSGQSPKQSFHNN